MIRWSRAIAVFGFLWAGTTVAACSGKALSLGSSTVTQAVDPGLVAQAAGSCPTGYAHPNICCAQAASGVAQCEVYANAPFLACPSAYSTLPDPRSCCPLDPSAGPCVSPDAGGSPPPDGGGSQCVYACPLGWYPPSSAVVSGGSNEGTPVTTAASSGCCSTDSSGDTVCAYPVDACPVEPQTVCACPAILVNADGSTTGPGCNCGTPASSSCTLPSAPPEPVCSPCPDDWQVPTGEPGLCCQTQSDGVIECFSQASAPPAPPVASLDAGSPPPALDASSPGMVDGSPPPALDATSPAQDAATGTCMMPTDCTGALPALCEICSDGGNGCAHFTCIDNQCGIGYCD